MTETFLSACRACGGSHLTPAFTLGTDNAWAFCGDASGEGGCGLLQRATIGGAKFRHAIPSLSWTEQYRLRGAVAGALEMVTTRDGVALDIGCGNGALLAGYPRWITPIGIDERLERTGPTDWGIGIADDFLADSAQETLSTTAANGFDIITCVDALERTDDPTTFLHHVKSLLARDGVFVLETPYAALALPRTMTSTFHRQSMAVYTLATLERLARNAGFRIVRGQMTESAGGSIRLYLSHDTYHGHDYGPWFEMLARLWDEENALCLKGRAAYHAYQMRLDARAHDVAALKAQMIRGGEHAYVIGTCSRTMGMLQAGDLDYDVISAHIGDVAREGFPEIITDEIARDAAPDVLIAPTWRRRETLESWQEAVMDGTRIVFVEPELLVVDASNYAMELGRALAVTDGPGSVETLRAALSAMRGPKLKVVTPLVAV
ncbi:class I SAM-dependent methyltransferase [Parvularcula sp. LCG005]|uniref:class I SAM-dependent methyltransferase n=1 Tax=Parvularcula sp. LCG005 TaxID=3078805 RepID=UPI00294280AB|nr:class I SAM-dependent methyltransferase [Parvularcula sp. LCG005]WOI53836.1 class I SAM-dependent methyltransferase [Parvularcula sp. LCG005]